VYIPAELFVMVMLVNSPVQLPSSCTVARFTSVMVAFTVTELFVYATLGVLVSLLITGALISRVRANASVDLLLLPAVSKATTLQYHFMSDVKLTVRLIADVVELNV